ncbi:MAG TPA: FkbM family methyltransferase [Bryobacteraceae bacterium]|nr:FkbM family methyltransferase [Bryobacteraceae bacterium]
MHGIRRNCEFVQRAKPSLGREPFTLIDIGCAGGLDAGWRLWEEKLHAFAFDANLDECGRLTAAETLAGVGYIPAFVGLRRNHPFAIAKAGRKHIENSPWERFSAPRSQRIRQRAAASGSPIEAEPVEAGLNTGVRLADEGCSVFLPEFFAQQQIDSVDFIKLDADGPDFEILHSLEFEFDRAHVLAVGMEVNFIGSAAETDHTFHNTDRFLRERGFDLFQLSIRRYSSAALPARYVWRYPAETHGGRPVQGDALYVRDVCSPNSAGFAAALTPEKLLKTAAIFALFDVPDCAAEILVGFRPRLAAICDVDRLLDTLAAQAQEGAESPLSYRDYLAAFERNDDTFYSR